MNKRVNFSAEKFTLFEFNKKNGALNYRVGVGRL